METREATAGTSRLVTLAALAAVVVALSLARDLLIPLALAILLSFLLAPLVSRLERMGLSRIPAVAVVVVIAALPLVVIGWIAVVQFIDLANALPTYRANIEAKLRSLQAPAGGMVERAMETVRELGLQGAAVEPQPTPRGEVPTPVIIVEPPPKPLQLVTGVVGPLAGPLATLGIVIVFMIFMLIQREDLRDRMIRLISQGQLTLTTQALAEVGSRISRYLRSMLLLNIGFGILASIGLLLIGVPNAVLWGLLSVGLRFIPYAGPVLSAGMPILLSLAVSDSWTMPLLTAALYITLEAISGNFFEPWLYGSTTGISSLALLVAAVFWAWLWGVPGLLLSTPLTVCLAVAGRYVPQLAFLSVLLGAEPVMAPQMRLYQRLLAMDYDEASEIAAEYLETHSLAEVFDDLLIPTLRATDEDAERRTLDERRRHFIYVNMRDLIDELAQRSLGSPPAREGSTGAREAPGEGGPQTAPGAAEVVVVEPRTPSLAPASEAEARRVRVLCVPARDEADVLAAQMLGYLLAGAGIGSETLSLEDMGTDLAAVASEVRPELACISSVPPFAATQARLRLRQVGLKAPGVRTVIGLWGIGEGALRSRDRLLALGAEAVVFTMAEAVAAIPALLRADGGGGREGRDGAAGGPHAGGVGGGNVAGGAGGAAGGREMGEEGPLDRGASPPLPPDTGGTIMHHGGED